MNAELLQQLLEMVGQAGEGSFVLAIIYIAYPYFVSTLTVIGIIIALFAVSRWISHITFARRVAATLGISIRGDVHESDRQDVINKIKHLQNNQK